MTAAALQRLQGPQRAVGRHGDDAADRLAAPAGDDLVGAVEFPLEVVIGVDQIELAAPHHGIGFLHRPPHAQLKSQSRRHAEIVQDGIPAFRRQCRALLVEDAENKRFAIRRAGQIGQEQQSKQHHYFWFFPAHGKSRRHGVSIKLASID